ncbi:MAG TPA: PHP domain-containing protein, partial [Acidimicrobiales bacterium]|nr:PHP domain-containing protein [Acidimicrobiales bacterium]
ARLEARPPPDPGPGAGLLATLRGDCHSHSDWSDGGSPIGAMARAAAALGHEYLVLTDHSPRLTVANGLSAEHLARQVQVVEGLAGELAPFRLLTGIEVDILEDGDLDGDDEQLARLDLVVASVHSKLRMAGDAMTRRMVRALAHPAVDVLGHCTGRLLGGRDRPPSAFDAEEVFHTAASLGKAVEVNCRPERLDPPRHLLRQAVAAGCLVAIDTDAHAPGQLAWQAYGCARAAACEVPEASVVNTWPVSSLVAWTRTHRGDRGPR